MPSENIIAYTAVKRAFDAGNPQDLETYQRFITTGRWNPNCPFILEAPYDNVISMIERRITARWLQSMIAEANLDEAGA